MEIIVREIHEPEEFFPIEGLQSAIWGDPEDVMPARSMMAMVHEGGLLAGAYVGENLVGFVFGFPTAHNLRHHSHMAGVLEEYRGTKAALLLKFFQRDWCLNKGYQQAVWTYDPMRGVNANFNLRKLGVTWNQYIPNCYGMMTGINAGAPSDRAYAVWDLRSERVYPRIYGVIPEPDLSSAVDVNQVEQGRPVDIGFGLEAAKLLVQIPEDWGQILQADTELARAWRMHSREVFGHYFSQGYRVSDFVRHPNRYVLEREV